MKPRPELLSDSELKLAWENAFDKPVPFYRILNVEEMAEEMVNIRLRAVAKAQRQKDIEFYEKAK